MMRGLLVVLGLMVTVVVLQTLDAKPLKDKMDDDKLRALVNLLKVGFSGDESVNEGGGAVAEWVRALDWTGDRTVPAGFESHCGKASLRNFGNSVHPALPVSFGGIINIYLL